MRTLKAIFLSLVLIFHTVPSGNTASLTDCISVTNGQFKKGIFDTSYEISVRNICGDSFKELLNYTSLSFYAGTKVLNPERATILFLQSYGQMFSFKLRNLEAGTYSPYLKIWSPKDYSSRTVYLPGFSIVDPLDCIAVDRSEFINSRFDPLLRVILKNSCPDLDSNTFSGFRINLRLPGYLPYLSDKTIFSLSSYGSSFDFLLRDIKPGNYFPVVEVQNSNYQTLKFNLSNFSVLASATSAPIPNNSNATSSGTIFKTVCAVSKEFSEQCSDFPEFNFDLCSSLKRASLQEKVGTKWVSLGMVSGNKDSSICPNSRYPYYILASGTNASGKKTELRLVFTKTAKVPSFTQNFTLIYR
jgi:hypothetical protein